MPIFTLWSLIPLAIIVFGAYHTWLTFNAIFDKTFKHWHEDSVKLWSAVTIAVTILIMIAPFLIPGLAIIKVPVFGLYVLYVGTTAYHVGRWWFNRKKNNTNTTNTTNSVQDPTKKDNSGK